MYQLEVCADVTVYITDCAYMLLFLVTFLEHLSQEINNQLKLG